MIKESVYVGNVFVIQIVILVNFVKFALEML